MPFSSVSVTCAELLFVFFQKIAFAREKSDLVAKIDGSFKARPKRKTAAGTKASHLSDIGCLGS